MGSTTQFEGKRTRWFEGFKALDLHAGGVEFAGVIGGSGPPVLLLHGYPQSHITWRHIAPRLAATHTIIAPDLPGYGDSKVDDFEPRWTKRRVAEALVLLTERLGWKQFSVVGHDRGARVGYRLALDFPEKVSAFASLTVVPTIDVFERMDRQFGLAAWHWFFMAQPDGLPEAMLSHDPDTFIETTLTKMAMGLSNLEPDVVDAYRNAFRDANVRRAMCDDYRAGAGEDIEHDRADRSTGRKLQCPVLVLWPQGKSAPERTPLDVWKGWADDVRGEAIPGGHLQPELSPEDVLAHLEPFLP